MTSKDIDTESSQLAAADRSIRAYRRNWLLLFVPDIAYGRWIAAAVIVLVSFLVYGIAAWLAAEDPTYLGRFFSVPSALFFIAIVAYLVPVFHYITARTHGAIDTLEPYFANPDVAAELHRSVEKRSVKAMLRIAFVGIVLWFGQSYLLAGSLSAMWFYLTDNYVSFTMSAGPLFVWLAMSFSLSALSENAKLFANVVKTMNVDAFVPDSYLPVGQIAVYSTLVVLGGLALLPIMWMDGPVDWWTTLPAVLLTLPVLLRIMLLPVLPLRRRLREQKQAAMSQAQDRLNASRAHDTPISEETLKLLTMRQQVDSLPEWPFNVSAIVRLLAYLVIVPLTWAGAAIIEMLVNMLLA